MKRIVRHAMIGTLIAITLASPAVAQEIQVDSPRADLPYSAAKSDPVTHQVDLSVVVTPPYHCQVLKVWIPIPQSDVAQQISDSRLSTFPLKIEPQINTESKYGNQFAYFEFHQPKGAQIIRHRFTAKVWTMNWDVDPESVVDVGQWHASFKPYLKPQSLADQEQFHAIVKQVVPERRGAAEDFASIIDWVDSNLIYDHVNASLRADAEHAIGQRRGHCSDYHGLCATMGRALGYPTRVTYGLALFPKNSPSHCKMEAFLPPHGWVSFDVSETQKMVKRIGENNDLTAKQKQKLTTAARKRLMGGFRENSWLLMTKGTDYDLAPKASSPVRVVRTAYVEADGQPLPDPDPANIEKREFAWMTVHHYQADREFALPFKDVETLSVE